MLFYSIIAGLQGGSQLVIIGMYLVPISQLVIGIAGVTSWDKPKYALACLILGIIAIACALFYVVSLLSAHGLDALIVLLYPASFFLLARYYFLTLLLCLYGGIKRCDFGKC